LQRFNPWFGDADHIQVGYSSNDPAVIHKQIEEAKNWVCMRSGWIGMAPDILF
jgi:hypothetical protein